MTCTRSACPPAGTDGGITAGIGVGATGTTTAVAGVSEIAGAAAGTGDRHPDTRSPRHDERMAGATAGVRGLEATTHTFVDPPDPAPMQASAVTVSRSSSRTSSTRLPAC